MVVFYDKECNGVLKFVIKLDESEIIKGPKLERMSMTLMNRALDPTITKKDLRYFSVQLENEIWWLTEFELPKEDHETLKVFFNLTEIPDVIRQQNEGEKLYVRRLYAACIHNLGDSHPHSQVTDPNRPLLTTHHARRHSLHPSDANSIP